MTFELPAPAATRRAARRGGGSRAPAGSVKAEVTAQFATYLVALTL